MWPSFDTADERNALQCKKEEITLKLMQDINTIESSITIQKLRADQQKARIDADTNASIQPFLAQRTQAVDQFRIDTASVISKETALKARCVKSVLVNHLSDENMVPVELLENLYDYQVALVNRMTKVANDYVAPKYIGNLANKVGTGKTRTALAFAFTQALHNKRKSLVVVPQRMIDHWIGQWKVLYENLGTLQEKVKVVIIRDVRGLDKLTVEALPDVLIIGRNTFLKYRSNSAVLKSEDFAVNMFDEWDTFTEYAKVMRITNARHVWVISATIAQNDLCRLRHGMDTTVMATEEFIASEVVIPPPVVKHIKCKGIDEAFRKFIPRETLVLLNQGDEAGALRSLGGSKSFENIAQALTAKVDRELDAVRKAIKNLLPKEKGKKNAKRAKLNNDKDNAKILDATITPEIANTIAGPPSAQVTSEETDEDDEIEMSKDKDMDEAIARIPRGHETLSEIVPLVKNRQLLLEKRADLLERIQNTNCPICLGDEKDAIPAIMNCCSQRMCLECLLSHLAQNSRNCPYCRSDGAMDFQVMRGGNEAVEVDSLKNCSGMLLPKSKTLTNLIKSMPEKSFLIFSDNGETFQTATSLDKEGIRSKVLLGSSAQARNIISDHVQKKFQVLFINRKVCGEGIHLAHADAIIFFHSLDHKYQYMQATARANRLPRTKALEIFHLTANDEKIYIE